MPLKSESACEHGFVLVFFTFCLFVLIALLGVVMDFGHAFSHQRRLQLAADLGAYVGASTYPATTWSTAASSYASVEDPVLDLTATPTVQVGCWNSSSRIFSLPSENVPNGNGNSSEGGSPGGTSSITCSSGSVVAVKVATVRQISTFFARILGVSSLSPRAEAVATVSSNLPSNCVRPFGVEQASLVNLEPGSSFTTSSPSPGNWGKLDIILSPNSQMSSGQNFEQYMLTDICSPFASIGQTVDSGTGFGGSINHVFDNFDLPQYSDVRNGMIFPLTTDFGNGNRPVTILEFVKVNFISQEGSGSNWRGTFEIVERNVTPPVSTSSTSKPRLVL